jgi:hypothetical protein
MAASVPEGESQHDGGQQRVDRRQRRQRMETAAASFRYRSLMGRRNVHLPKKKGSRKLGPNMRVVPHQPTPDSTGHRPWKLPEQGRFQVKPIDEISSIPPEYAGNAPA